MHGDEACGGAGLRGKRSDLGLRSPRMFVKTRGRLSDDRLPAIPGITSPLL